MRFVKQSMWVIVVMVGLYGILGFVMLPFIAKQQLPSIVNDVTHGHATIYDLTFNPFTFELEAEEIEFRDPQWGEIVKINSLAFNLDLVTLLEQKIVLKALSISGVRLHHTQYQDGGYTTDWLQYLPAFEALDEHRQRAVNVRIDIDAVVMDHLEFHLVNSAVHVNAFQVVSPKMSLEKVASATTVETVQKEDVNATVVAKPLQFHLNTLEVVHGAASYRDETFAEPVALSLEDFAVTVKDISTVSSPFQYQLSTSVNGQGSIEASGQVDLNRQEQRGRFTLQNIPLKPLSPYIEAQSYIALKNGFVGIRGETVVSFQGDQPDIQFQGQIGVQKFKVVDTHDDTLLMGLNDVRVQPIEYRTSPPMLTIASVEIEGLYANAVVAEDQSFNFAKLIKGEENATTSKPPKHEATKPPLDIQVGRVEVSGSHADFADFSLPLRFQTHVSEINGSIIGIASHPKGVSHVDVKGVVDQYGDARLKGSFNSADPKHFTDLNMAFRNLTLNAYSPYSVKFVGRKIDEGRLYVDLGYHIVEHQLQGDNKVVIKKIRMGESVESEGAMALPLDLAIALLEDSDGVIDIDLPVAGDLDHPEFEYGPAVWNAVVNLLTNIVTAPFKFLGAILGIEGESLEFIEFEPGGAQLLPPEQEKLDRLKEALEQRPRLRLEVGGCYHDGVDQQALRRQRAEALILAHHDGDTVVTAPLSLLETLNMNHMEATALQALRQETRDAFQDDTLFTQMYRQALMEHLQEVQEINATGLKQLAHGRGKAIMSYLEVQHDRLIPRDFEIVTDEETTWVRCSLGIAMSEGRE